MTKTIAQKLFIKANSRIGIFLASDEFITNLAVVPTTTDITSASDLDAVILFVKSVAELEQYALDTIKSLKYDGLLWIAYPKKRAKIASDIDRDHGWHVIHGQGLRPVASIAIDDTWSALRFRPTAEVKAQTK